MSTLKALLAALEGADPDKKARVLAAMSAGDVRALAEDWETQALTGQFEPGGVWSVWLMMAGRGFGKTRAGAEWVWAQARAFPGARIALVGASIEDAVRVMIEGESGLIAAAATGERARWRATRREIEFPSGAIGFVYSGANPESLRGPQHHFAWCDEIAKWRHARAAWDNLQLGMRLGAAPRIIVTTTPRPGTILKSIRALPGTVTTGGRTADNIYSAATYRTQMAAIYGGTQLGRQELDGELIEDVAGSLWPRDLIERCRTSLILPGTGRWQAKGLTEGANLSASRAPSTPAFGGGPPPRPGEDLRRIVIGVDPPASADGDACGIVVCGVDEAGIGYVLADHSVAGLRPDGWARAVAGAAQRWGADRIIAEKNNGGDMVESVLRGADAMLPVTLVSASRGKAARAEPVATRFEAGKAWFAGRFPELEDELNGMTPEGYRGAGSPDRADAMVWAMSALIKPTAEPRILVL